MTTIDNIMALHNAASHAAVQYALLAQVSLRSERSMQALEDRNEANEALRTALTEALAPKLEQDPVAELGVSSFTWLKDRPPAGTKLYAAPQAAQQVREPMTLEQIKAAYFCHEIGHVSVSLVQRKLRIGYNKAQTLCESIIRAGLVHGLNLAPTLHGIGGDK